MLPSSWLWFISVTDWRWIMKKIDRREIGSVSLIQKNKNSHMQRSKIFLVLVNKYETIELKWILLYINARNGSSKVVILQNLIFASRHTWLECKYYNTKNVAKPDQCYLSHYNWPHGWVVSKSDEVIRKFCGLPKVEKNCLEIVYCKHYKIFKPKYQTVMFPK